jgi:hypothetical protein
MGEVELKQGWQPIESAPKDGTVVRVNGPHDLYPMDAQYVRFANEWYPVPQRLTLGREQIIPDPTHWMPLPEPPDAQQ